MTPQEFSAKIREKYPNSYKNVDDETLARKVIEKYPQYATKVTFGPEEKTLSGLGENALEDAGDIASGLGTMAKGLVTHPIDTSVATVKAVPGAVKGMWEGYGGPELMEGEFSKAGQKIADTAYDRPVSTALDALTVALPVAKGIGLGAKAGEVASAAGKAAKIAGVEDILEGGSRVMKRVKPPIVNPVADLMEATTKRPLIEKIASSSSLTAKDVVPAIQEAKSFFQKELDKITAKLNGKPMTGTPEEGMIASLDRQLKQLEKVEAKLKAASTPAAASNSLREVTSLLQKFWDMPLTTKASAITGSAVGGAAGKLLPIPGASAGGAALGAVKGAGMVPYGAASLKIAAGKGLEQLGDFARWAQNAKSLPPAVLSAVIAQKAAKDPEFKAAIDKLDTEGE